MVGTRRNTAASEVTDPSQNKSKKFTKAQLKAVEDESNESINSSASNTPTPGSSSTRKMVTKAMQKQMVDMIESPNTTPVNVEPVEADCVPKRRGRPRKSLPSESTSLIDTSVDAPKKKGRPPKKVPCSGEEVQNILPAQVSKVLEQIKSDVSEDTENSSNSNSPSTNRSTRSSRRLRQKASLSDEVTSSQEEDTANTTEPEESLKIEIYSDIQPSNVQNKEPLVEENTEEEESDAEHELPTEEAIEIVIEEHTESSVDSQPELSPYPQQPSPAIEDFDYQDSPGISVEIVEDSNADENPPEIQETVNSPVAIEEPQEPTEEEEVSIVYLDENDTVLSETENQTKEVIKQMEISDSEDSTLDSFDLKGVKNEKLELKHEHETMYDLENDNANQGFEDTREENIKIEEENVVAALENKVQNIQIHESTTSMDCKLDEETHDEEPKAKTLSVPSVETAKTESENIQVADSKQEEKPESMMEEEQQKDESMDVSDSNSHSNSNEAEDVGDSKSEAKQELNEDGSLRRSSRIKTISTQNRRSVGHGLVKDRDKFLKKKSAESNNSPSDPGKIKSRWRRLSEIEQGIAESESKKEDEKPEKTQEEIEEEQKQQQLCEAKLKYFVNIKENEYKCDRNVSKEAKKMLCDCFLTPDEYERGELGCGEDCLNRLLMIECSPKCTVGDRCTNKRFQKMQYAKCKVFRTEKKGFGIAAAAEIHSGEFIMEYVGEVLDSEQFEKRAGDYSDDKNRHYYFMALRSDAVIDATVRGNISRFINHSCDPNAETQKWTVNGELRIGFFSKRTIPVGEEITFDYQFQRYGKEAQKCYCEAANCRGWIGQAPGEEDSEISEVSESESEHEVEPEKSEKTIEEQAKIDAQKAIEKEKKIKAKANRQKRAYRRKQHRQEILDDLDLDDEINILYRSGLKNQQHTLKLSRLMVRAKLLEARSKLLSLLKTGELPCRRLFLDYHGLRLLHGWMEDTPDPDLKTDLKFRKAILQVLEVLPITNKTILKDSKVLSVVQKWANENDISPNSNSPNDESSGSGTATPQENTEENKSTNLNSDIFKHIPDLIKQSEELMKSIGVDELKHIIDSYGQIREHVQKEKEEKIKAKLDEANKAITKTEEKDAENVPKEDEKCEDKTTLKVEEKETVEPDDPKEFKIPREDLKAIEEQPISEELVNEKAQESVPEKGAPDSALLIQNQLVENKTPEEKTDETTIESEQKLEPEEKPESLPKPVLETDKVLASDGLDDETRGLKHEIFKLAKALLSAWKDLKEVFRIPKKERIEQMKEHEREADLRYQSLKLEDKQQHSDRYSSRFRDRSSYDSRTSSSYKEPRQKQSQLSKYQRRHLFEMRVAQQEAEKRNQEIWYCHDQNCLKFGLNPRQVSPNDVPAMMNPITGQYYSFDRRQLPTPPSHQYMKIIPPPLSTNPADYELPLLDLPPMWKFAIDERGRIYYYHVKIRIPQWEPPIKIQPLAETKPDLVDDEDVQLSDPGTESSTTDTCDSEEEELKEKLEILQKCKEKGKTQFNLDDLLAKPSDLTDADEHGLDPIPSVEETNNLLGAQDKADILNTATNFNKSLDSILPNLKRIKRKRSGLVQERSISPRTEEDKIRGKQEMMRYKETKEKLRRRKEDAKRKQIIVATVAGTSTAANPDGAVRLKIVDELDILRSNEAKRPSVYEEWKKQEQKMRLEKKRAQKLQQQQLAAKRKKTAEASAYIIDPNSEEARKIKDKFKSSIAEIIVQHLRPYMKDSCQIGKITNNDDFKHLARKLTHFVMLKELKHCDNTVTELEVTESVKIKAREFVKKYMAKYGSVYVRPENEPDFKD